MLNRILRILKPSSTIAVVILQMMAFIANAQDYEITFSASGYSSIVDSVLAQNLTTGSVIALAGDDTLHLVQTTGWIEPELTPMRVYPNPVDEECRVEFFQQTSEMLGVQVFDMGGKLLFSKSQYVESGARSFTINGFSKGFYLLVLASESQVLASKIISLSIREGCFEISMGPVEFAYAIPSARIKSEESNTMIYHESDILLFEGISDTYSRIVTHVASQDQTIDFNFIPCTDGAGNNYPVVTIGDQTWMAKNLNTNKLNDGQPIEYRPSGYFWQFTAQPAYCFSNDNSANGNIYGNLYNWKTVDTEKLCPLGWAVPSKTAWDSLVDYLGIYVDAGGLLKETGNTHWASPNTGANNATGFSAIPGGDRTYDGNDYRLGYHGFWWTNTEWSTSEAYAFELSYHLGGIYELHKSKGWGCSVRCIKQ